MRSLAGVLMNRGRNEFVVVDSDVVLATVKVLGNRVYCHKCERDVKAGGQDSVLVMPDRSTTDHSIFTVLAIGEAVDDPMLEPLDIVTVPEHCVETRGSPYHTDEYFLHYNDLQLMRKQVGAVNHE